MQRLKQMSTFFVHWSSYIWLEYIGEIEAKISDFRFEEEEIF